MGRHISRVIDVSVIIAAVAALSAATLPAIGASTRVTMACAGDYLAYCSRHPTEGPAVRQCMRVNGHKLSKRCIDALIAAGEVSKSEVDRRAAAAGR
jgi:hypothetical protein